MKRQGETKCSEMRENVTDHNAVVIGSDCKRMKAEVLMEMGLAMLDDEPSSGGEIEPLITHRSPYSRAEPVETRLLCNVSEDLNNFASPFGDDFMLYKKQKSRGLTGQDQFGKLSDEMVLSIFRWLPKKYLTRCAAVCRRWRRIAYDEELWTRFDLGTKTIEQGSLANVLKRGVRILRLAQASIRSPVFEKDALPDEYCSRLQFLDLSMAVISEKDLAVLLRCTKHLLKLSLEHCTLSDEVCESIGQNTQLEVLNLSMCYNLTPKCIDTIMMNCKRLQSLNMGWTSLSLVALDSLMKCVPHTLQQLNLSGCKDALTDQHVAQLVRRCPQLTELDLSDALITGASMDSIRQLRNLEHLSLSRCYQVPGMSMLKLHEMESLRYLDLFGLVTEQNHAALQKNLPAIEINKFMFSSIARPTVGIRRTSIWGLRVRD